MNSVALPSTATSSTYLPGLDGLRALSVLVVVAFHTGLIDGGWIGVDVFFGISGFLITGLMIAENNRTGRIALGAFWMRRIRRLVPALIVLLGLVAVLVRIDQVEVTSRNIWGAVTYSSNWFHIFGGTSYWDQFATPDPLRHLWSLAIEEQFYVLWPLVVVLVLRRHSVAAVTKVALIGAFLSAAIQVVGIHGGLSLDRIYQGTDTRAVAFLLGAVLATRGWPTKKSPSSIRLLAVIALAVLVPAVIWLPGEQRWVFSGPLLVVSLAGIVAVAYATTSTNRLLHSRLLGRIGRWSYGIYLFHWPLVVARTFDDLHPTARFLIITVISTALAALSYRLVEAPIRHRRLAQPLMAGSLMAGAIIVVVSFVVAAPTAPPLNATVTLAPRLSVDAIPDAQSPAIPLPTRVMVFGDSVPAVAADELQAEAESLGVDIEVRADPGCAPSEDKQDQYRKPECVTFLQGTRQRAEELEIDTAIIWWGGTGPIFVEQGTPYYFCRADARELTRERLRRLVGYFTGVATKIILVAPVPRLDQVASDIEGTECEIVAYDDVGAELGIEVIRLRDDVCPSYPDDCSRIERYDGLHYNGTSARQVAKIILSHL